jgi:hypothetical protein
MGPKIEENRVLDGNMWSEHSEIMSDGFLRPENGREKLRQTLYMYPKGLGAKLSPTSLKGPPMAYRGQGSKSKFPAADKYYWHHGGYRSAAIWNRWNGALNSHFVMQPLGGSNGCIANTLIYVLNMLVIACCGNNTKTTQTISYHSQKTNAILSEFRSRP